jgi:hypothetical protein
VAPAATASTSSSRSSSRTALRTNAALRDRSRPSRTERWRPTYWSQTSASPHGSASASTVASEPTTIATAGRQPPRRHTSQSTASAAGPAKRLFTANANPRTRAVATVRRRDGAPLATSTAVAESAAVTPSDSIRLVENTTSPLPATRRAASAAPHRSAVLTPSRWTTTTSATPAASGSRRGDHSVRRPTASASPTRGRKAGPCEEKTSRYGRPPARSAPAEARYTPSS